MFTLNTIVDLVPNIISYILTFIGIWISIRGIYYPYRIKIKTSYTSFLKEIPIKLDPTFKKSESCLNLKIINSGNRKIKLKSINVYAGRDNQIVINDIFTNFGFEKFEEYIEPGESKSIDLGLYEISYCLYVLSNKIKRKNKKLKFAFQFENGKTYKLRTKYKINELIKKYIKN